MNQSQEISELAAALAKAQGKIEGAKKDSEATVTGSVKRKYADLSSVWDACRKQLSENGLSVTQITEGGPDSVTVITRLMHTSGQWIEGALTMKPMQMTPQGLGSCITYCRRYALASMVGVCPDDDDAEEASKPPVKPSRPVEKPEPMPEPSEPKSAPKQVREILKLQMANNLTVEQVMKITGLDTLKGLTEAQAIDALDKLSIHVQDLKQA